VNVSRVQFAVLLMVVLMLEAVIGVMAYLYEASVLLFQFSCQLCIVVSWHR